MIAAPPDWITLRLLVSAAELGSITRAAAQCGLAPSAAAKRLQDLDADVGLMLLERSSRGVRATTAGEAVVRHARALLHLAARMGEDLRALSQGGIGIVRVHATLSTIVGHDLGPSLAAFLQQPPNIWVELEEHTSAV